MRARDLTNEALQSERLALFSVVWNSDKATPAQKRRLSALTNEMSRRLRPQRAVAMRRMRKMQREIDKMNAELVAISRALFRDAPPEPEDGCPDPD